MSPSEAEWLLEEWAAWSRGGDVLSIGWAPATPFGRLIKPDPMPARLPVEPDRAMRTDRVVAKLPPRRRLIVQRPHILQRHRLSPRAAVVVGAPILQTHSTSEYRT